MGDLANALEAPAAKKLVAALLPYEKCVKSLTFGGWNSTHYSESWTLFDQLQLHAANLPEVRVLWVDVLISRYEFLQVLWTGTAGSDEVLAGGARHLGALTEFANRCRAKYIRAGEVTASEMTPIPLQTEQSGEKS